MYVSSSLINGTGPFFNCFVIYSCTFWRNVGRKGSQNMHMCAPNATSVWAKQLINRLTAVEESIEEIKYLCLWVHASS